MQILKKLIDFLKRAFSSRGGQIVFLVNLALMIYVFTTEGTFYDIKYHCCDSVPFHIMMVTSIPAIIAAAIIAIPLDFISSNLTLNYIYPALIFIFWTIQWVSVGYGLEKLFRRYVLKNKP